VSETKFYCQHCGQPLEAPDDIAGESVDCPACGISLVVPAFSASASQALADAEDGVSPSNQDGSLSQPEFSAAWRRFIAYDIDLFITEITYGVCSLVFWGIFRLLVGLKYFDVGVVCVVLMRVLIEWLYYALMESHPVGATFGKQFLGIRVQDVVGFRISFWRATARRVAPFVLVVPALLALIVLLYMESRNYAVIIFLALLSPAGYLWVLNTPRKQSLYDIWTRTVVVRSSPDTGQLHNLSPWLTALLIASMAVGSSTFTMYAHSRALHDSSLGIRFAQAFLISLVCLGPLAFVLTLLVKIVRGRGRRKDAAG